MSDIITTLVVPPPIVTTVVTPPPIITNLTAGQGPAGVGLSSTSLTATENLVAGDLVNVYSGGVRKASRDHALKECSGFVTVPALIGNPVTVNFAGANLFVTGLTVGPVYLGLNGQCTNTPPSIGPGLVQQVGFATAANRMNFMLGLVVVLAGTPD